jgi:hypothetical protein
MALHVIMHRHLAWYIHTLPSWLCYLWVERHIIYSMKSNFIDSSNEEKEEILNA